MTAEKRLPGMSTGGKRADLGSFFGAVETCLRRWLFSRFLIAFQKGSFFSPRGTQNRFFGWLPEVRVCVQMGAHMCLGLSPPSPASHPPWLPESQEEEVAGRYPGEVGLG